MGDYRNMATHRVKKGAPVLLHKPGYGREGDWLRGKVKEVEGDWVYIKLCGSAYTFAVRNDSFPDKWKHDHTQWSTGKHTTRNRNPSRSENEARERRRRAR